MSKGTCHLLLMAAYLSLAGAIARWVRYPRAKGLEFKIIVCVVWELT